MKRSTPSNNIATSLVSTTSTSTILLFITAVVSMLMCRTASAFTVSTSSLSVLARRGRTISIHNSDNRNYENNKTVLRMMSTTSDKKGKLLVLGGTGEWGRHEYESQMTTMTPNRERDGIELNSTERKGLHWNIQPTYTNMYTHTHTLTHT